MKKTFAIPDAAMPFAGFTSRQLARRAVRSPPGLSIDPNSGAISPTADADSPYSVAVDAADSITGTDDPQTFNWTVSPVTVSLTNPGDQTNYDADTVSLALSATDSAGHNLTYNVTGGALPPGLSISDGAVIGTISNTADTDSPYSVTITATDGAAEVSSDPQTFNWTVNNPVALTNPGAQTNFDGDTGVSLQLSTSDADGNPVTYSLTSGSLPTGLSLDTSTGAITGNVSSTADTGSPYSVTVTATDSVNGTSDTQTFYWYVSEVTVILDSVGDQTNCDGDTVSLALPRSDSANNPLTFTATNLPEGLSIDPDSGEISGTIASDGPIGVNSVTVTATDSIADVSASQTFNWNIVSIMIINPGDQYNVDGDTVDLPLQTETSYMATDAYAFSETGLPPGLSMDTESGEITGTIATDADTGSPYAVEVTVADPDAGVSANQTFTWTVCANTATVYLANPGTERTTDGQSFSLNLMGLDSIGDPLTFSATGLPAGVSVVGNQITGTLASNADAASPYYVTATATDVLAGVNASESFEWYVRPVSAHVSLTSIGNQTSVDETTVDLGLSASDSTGDPLTFGATGLPPGLSVDPDSGDITGTIDPGDYANGPYSVELTATDAEAGVDACQDSTWFCTANASESTLEPSTIAMQDSSDNPSASGQAVTLVALVSGDAGVVPTGSVTFMDGTRNLGSGMVSPTGYATLSTAALSIGNHAITAVYAGDATYAGSTSAPYTQTVTGGFATGQVWVDANSNGLFDSGEAGLAGVTVNLLNASGAVVTATTTNNAGAYTFNTLLPNTSYAIQVVPSAGYALTFYQVGNNPLINSAVGPNIGQTVSFQVALGASVTMNCGLINTNGVANNSITGPGAVPGNSTYNYLISLPGQPCGCLSVTGQGDAGVTIGAGLVVYNAATNTTLESWPLTFANAPADVTFSVRVGANVVASQEIYVVQVSVSITDDIDYFSPTNGLYVLPPASIATKQVLSGVPLGANWVAAVTLTGPGDNLGVSQIQVGFIQHITIQAWNGQYAAGAPGAPTQLISSLQTQTLLDMAADGGGIPGPTSTYTGGPWYDRQNGATFFNATAANASDIIGSFDQPGLPVPLTRQMATGTQVAANFGTFANTYQALTSVNLELNFNLDVAASTKSTANGANSSYWGEYRDPWTFNGTGTIGPPPAVLGGAGWIWEGNGAYTDGEVSWQQLVTPTPESTGGAIFNQAIQTVSFSSP